MSRANSALADRSKVPTSTRPCSWRHGAGVLVYPDNVVMADGDRSGGPGGDSTAVLVGLKHRGIQPDLIVIADVGGGMPETYLYAPIFRRWWRTAEFPQFEAGPDATRTRKGNSNLESFDRK